jgi:hypothetical protein
MAAINKMIKMKEEEMTVNKINEIEMRMNLKTKKVIIARTMGIDFLSNKYENLFNKFENAHLYNFQSTQEEKNIFGIDYVKKLVVSDWSQKLLFMSEDDGRLHDIYEKNIQDLEINLINHSEFSDFRMSSVMSSLIADAHLSRLTDADILTIMSSDQSKMFIIALNIIRRKNIDWLINFIRSTNYDQYVFVDWIDNPNYSRIFKLVFKANMQWRREMQYHYTTSDINLSQSQSWQFFQDQFRQLVFYPNKYNYAFNRACEYYTLHLKMNAIAIGMDKDTNGTDYLDSPFSFDDYQMCVSNFVKIDNEKTQMSTERLIELASRVRQRKDSNEH